MAELLPVLRQRFFDEDGNPLAGGKLYSYIAGTSTPSATYTDESGDTENANPTVLDADGYADIWIKGGTYKFRLTDANDVDIWTRDDVSRASEGPAGSSFLVGSGVPSAGLGNDGDNYLDTASGNLYLKASSVWGANGSLASIGFSTSSHSFTDGQSATSLTGETVNSASYKSVVYEFEIIRGTTVFANGRFSLQYLNSAWRIADGAYDGEIHGLTFTLSGTTTAQLRLAADVGAGNGTIKFKKILHAA